MLSGNLLTPTQAAQLIGKDRSTILRWCQRGKIKALKVGNQWLIDRESLEKYASRKANG